MDSSLYFYALLSTTCFASASLVFTEYSRKVGAVWMNCLKAVVAMIACFLVVSLFYKWNSVQPKSVMLFLFSGFFALNLGDILLLKAFEKIGPGRSLMLFGFHPLTLGIASYFIFGQEISLNKLYAIIFLILCLMTFSYEKFKSDGHWEIKGFLMALAAVTMDGIGLIITRLGFDLSPEITPLEGHFYRCLGASLGFLIVQYFHPFGFIKNFLKLSSKSKVISIIGGFVGTFLSLWAYFIAIQKGHLASITAIGITSPFLATVFECAYYRKKPSVYLIIAFVFFIAGFIILIK